MEYGCRNSAAGHSDPSTSNTYITTTNPIVTPSAGESRSNDTEAARPMAVNDPNSSTALSQSSGRFRIVISLATPENSDPATPPASSALTATATNPNAAVKTVR